MGLFACGHRTISGTRLAEPIRLSQIDDSNRRDHYHLVAGDQCLYLYEYTSGRDFTFSATNGLISNLKKKPSQNAARGYAHKGRVITECAAALGQSLNAGWLQFATLVPIPCSKARGHEDFDDRIEQLCRGISQGLDVRNLIVQSQSTTASHEAAAGDRITLEALQGLYQIDETLAAPPPKTIGIVDDVLTAGTHFRAAHNLLSARFPGAPIVGIFIARRIFPNPFGDAAAG